MTNNGITVIVLTYNPDWKKLEYTLNSILLQKEVDFEIIVADDGSNINFESELIQYFKNHKFSNYKLCMNQINYGTVKNLISALKFCNKEYVKTISPGDYLYDCYTLRDIYIFMKKYSANVAFGRAVYYYDDGKVNVVNISNPIFEDLYSADIVYDYKKVKKYQLVYEDFLLGASLIISTDILKEYLNIVVDKVRLLEDIIVQLLVIDNYRIYAIPRFILWYEYGNGVSTNANSSFSRLINVDILSFCNILKTKYIDKDYVYRVCCQRINRLTGNKIIREVRKIIELDKFLFRIKKKKKMKEYKCINYKIEEYFNILKYSSK